MLKDYCKALQLECVEARLPDHFHISNLGRMGHTEVELTQTVIDGICKLVQMSKSVQAAPDATKTAMLVAIEGALVIFMTAISCCSWHHSDIDAPSLHRLICWDCADNSLSLFRKYRSGCEFDSAHARLPAGL